MRPSRLVLFVCTSLLLAGCNGQNVGIVNPPAYTADPATTSYAASLNVDISSMTKTADSLYYKDLVTGTGATAAAGFTARVEYTGWLVNGLKFDTSVGKTPAYFEFLVNAGQVIKAWDKGVPGMKVGGKRQLVVPPALGYGETGSGAIPGNAILVFEITLLQVR